VCQVVIVGDLNVASSQKDVHRKLDYGRMYSPDEKAILHSLLSNYHDVWRLRHPDVDTAFTVWDEKTSARVFNEVRQRRSQHLPSTKPSHLFCICLKTSTCVTHVGVHKTSVEVCGNKQKQPGNSGATLLAVLRCSGCFDAQGVRIDYALVSQGLLGSVASCEIITSLPPKWSDHAAVLLELSDIPEPPKHAPCALSSRRMKRFMQPRTSVAALFAKKRAANGAAAAVEKRLRAGEREETGESEPEPTGKPVLARPAASASREANRESAALEGGLAEDGMQQASLMECAAKEDESAKAAANVADPSACEEAVPVAAVSKLSECQAASENRRTGYGDLQKTSSAKGAKASPSSPKQQSIHAFFSKHRR
jgi:hypothetical protein